MAAASFAYSSSVSSSLVKSITKESMGISVVLHSCVLSMVSSPICPVMPGQRGMNSLSTASMAFFTNPLHVVPVLYSTSLAFKRSSLPYQPSWSLQTTSFMVVLLSYMSATWFFPLAQNISLWVVTWGNACMAGSLLLHPSFKCTFKFC